MSNPADAINAQPPPLAERLMVLATYARAFTNWARLLVPLWDGGPTAAEQNGQTDLATLHALEMARASHQAILGVSTDFQDFAMSDPAKSLEANILPGLIGVVAILAPIVNSHSRDAAAPLVLRREEVEYLDRSLDVFERTLQGRALLPVGNREYVVTPNGTLSVELPINRRVQVVTDEPCRVVIDGVAHELDERGALYVDALVKANGRGVTFEQLKRPGSVLDGANETSLRSKLPEAVRRIIRPTRGHMIHFGP